MADLLNQQVLAVGTYNALTNTNVVTVPIGAQQAFVNITLDPTEIGSGKVMSVEYLTSPDGVTWTPQALATGVQCTQQQIILGTGCAGFVGLQMMARIVPASVLGVKLSASIEIQ